MRLHDSLTATDMIMPLRACLMLLLSVLFSAPLALPSTSPSCDDDECHASSSFLQVGIETSRTAHDRPTRDDFGQRFSLGAVDPLAVCNDGSPASYYFVPGKRPNVSEPSLWIVRLDGGGWCHNKAQCDHRCPAGTTEYSCSSKELIQLYPQEHFPEMLKKRQHPEHPDILDHANKVVVVPCTSDAFMGDYESDGHHFRGARVVDAVMSDLIRKQGLGSGKSEDIVLLSGGSAGARGAMVNLDHVAEKLGEINIPVLGLLDASLWLDMPPYDKSDFEGYNNMSHNAFQLFGGSVRLGAECAAAFPDEGWKCMIGEHRMPYIKTPYFLGMQEFEQKQLSDNGIYKDEDHDDGQEAYMLQLSHRMRDVMRSLRADWPADSPKQNAVWACACWGHGLAGSSLFDVRRCGKSQTTMREGLLEFLAQAPSASPRFEWVDECEGVLCGRGCNDPDPRLQNGADVDSGDDDD